jgi:hypothetical protein
MVSRRFRKEAVLTGFAAEAQPPMMMGDKAELPATVCATVFLPDHEAALPRGMLAVASCVASSDSDCFRAGDAKTLRVPYNVGRVAARFRAN